jgi:hypothetical protein
MNLIKQAGYVDALAMLGLYKQAKGMQMPNIPVKPAAGVGFSGQKTVPYKPPLAKGPREAPPAPGGALSETPPPQEGKEVTGGFPGLGAPRKAPMPPPLSQNRPQRGMSTKPAFSRSNPIPPRPNLPRTPIKTSALAPPSGNPLMRPKPPTAGMGSPMGPGMQGPGPGGPKGPPLPMPPGPGNPRPMLS